MNLRIYTAGEVATPLWDVLQPWLAHVNSGLSGQDYGGRMEHLWIEIELHEYGINVPERPPWPFRFQKRVLPRLPDGLSPAEPKFNVGHYSVRPTADDMRAKSRVAAARQVLAVVLESTKCLAGKQELRGFNVDRFRSDLAKAFEQVGSIEVLDAGNIERDVHLREAQTRLEEDVVESLENFIDPSGGSDIGVGE